MYKQIFTIFSTLAALSIQANADLPALLTRAHQLHLDQDPQWLNLLHYKNDWFGGTTSQAVGGKFFLAPDGRKNPQSELDAALGGFYSTEAPEPPRDQAPQCQFPARLLFLQSRLGFKASELPKQDCARFENFREKLAAKSITLVFSSYYLNNPSSAFGHSFLRVNKSKTSQEGRSSELLDYGINYAANADTDNPILYAVKGLTGLFPGGFTSVPYYYKVREYNDYEARDLWEYDLVLSDAEVEMLVAHFWELGATWFRYYYLTQNCSYHVLSVLDAVRPSLNLTNQISGAVIPADTVKLMTAIPGFINGVHFRPSVRTQFQTRIDRFNHSQLDQMDWVILHSQAAVVSADSPELVGLTSPQKIAVLDAAMDYVNLNFGKAQLDHKSFAAQWAQNLLVARAQISEPSPDLDVPTPWHEQPDTGHDSRRIYSDSGYNDSIGAFTTLGVRFSLHDLVDPLQGYPGYALLEMASLRLRYNEGQQTFWLDDAELFHVMTLNPLGRYAHKLSWNVQLAGTRLIDSSCDYCFGELFEAGAGYAVQPLNHLTVFLLGEGQFVISPSSIGAHFRPGVGPQSGVRYRPLENLGILAQAGYRYRFFDGPSDSSYEEVTARLAFHDLWAINFRATHYSVANEIAAGISIYH